MRLWPGQVSPHPREMAVSLKPQSSRACKVRDLIHLSRGQEPSVLWLACKSMAVSSANLCPRQPWWEGLGLEPAQDGCGAIGSPGPVSRKAVAVGASSLVTWGLCPGMLLRGPHGFMSSLVVKIHPWDPKEVRDSSGQRPSCLWWRLGSSWHLWWSSSVEGGQELVRNTRVSSPI